MAVRFENLADLFDYPKNAVLNDTTVYIDIPAFAQGLYNQANRDI